MTSLRHEDAPPFAASTLNSLRGVGYDAGSAMADLIDNSIAASATRIDLEFFLDGANSYVAVLDDGRGMSEDELSQAMRIGSKNPLSKRGPQDLGRFGMGLKTASLSQCRKLTVLSKTSGGQVTARCWDLDLIQETNQWCLLCEAQDLPSKLAGLLDARPCGTLVIWQKCDTFGAMDQIDGEKVRRAFYRKVESIEEHLRLFFHRYLEAPISLAICINGGKRIKPWDPFVTWHPATQSTPSERVGHDCLIKGYVLPHKDRINQDEFQKVGGLDGWTAQQGFYIYRNQRLLVAGSWLGLGDDRRWTKDEGYRLARLSLDISNESDAEWNIDIKKSVARPPERLRGKLTALAEITRKMARSVFAHRGSYGPRGVTLIKQPIWTSQLRGDHHVYSIRRDHPAVQAALHNCNDKKMLESLLRLVEETVPVQKIWLDVAEAGELSPEPFREANPLEIQTILYALYEGLTQHEGYTAEEARTRLMHTDPFHLYPGLLEQLKTLEGK